jgi:L-threonylcarbamoyladenylate synthase
LSQGEEQESPDLPLIVTAGLPTVALRMPSHPVALALIRAAGVPLAAPSANRFTQLSPTTAEHVRRGLGSDVDFVLDGGPCQVGIESTVVSLVSEPVLLRPGGISRPEIEAVIGPLAHASDPMKGSHPSPGMHPRHYSPRTKLILIPEGEVPSTGQGVFLQVRSTPSRADVVTIPMPADPNLYAARLYETLHRADSENYDWIAVEAPPDTPAWEAVLDRLRRASSG